MLLNNRRPRFEPLMISFSDIYILVLLVSFNSNNGFIMYGISDMFTQHMWKIVFSVILFSLALDTAFLHFGNVLNK